MGPFDRFNDRAKRVLALAQDEAIRLNHNYIGPEHLLLGLIREGEGVAARALDALGVSLSQIRTSVEMLIGRGDAMTTPSEISLSPLTKKVIEMAIDEAPKLGHSHVGTEHLLLGIVRSGHEGSGIAAKALAQHGIDTEKVREQVVATLGQRGAPPGDQWIQRHIAPDAKPPPEYSPREIAPHAPSAAGSGPFYNFDDSGKQVLAFAQDEAIRLNHNYIGTEHLLAGVLRADDIGAAALHELGVEISKVRTALEFIIGRGDTPTAPSDITLSPRTKKVIELSVDEARQLGHQRVGSGHVLLGLVREGQGIASGILESLGVALPTVRQKVVEIMGKREMGGR